MAVNDLILPSEGEMSVFADDSCPRTGGLGHTVGDHMPTDVSKLMVSQHFEAAVQMQSL